MILKSIKFCRNKGLKNEWSLEGKPENGIYHQPVIFQNINLVVGKNATGKSRTIDAIRKLSDLLAGDNNELKLSQMRDYNSIYELKFQNNGDEFDYYLELTSNHKVKKENLEINNEPKLTREDNKGNMFYEGIGNSLEFEMESDKLAVAQVNNIQQPFFEPLQKWGKTLNHYRFGEQLGKDILLRDINTIKEDTNINLKDGEFVIEIFTKGKNKFGEKFTQNIISDMEKISYHITEIKIDNIKHNVPISLFGLNIQENDIEELTYQIDISQGMFRALSLIIQLNFSLLDENPSCILIDDIGEGLDYERSKSLIDLIIEKVKNSPIQVIMTTNDRFVMNNVPLEYWSVIHRTPKKSLFYNYQNSKETFDDFKFTGLSNFDFLSTEFYVEGFEQSEEKV